MSSTTPVNVDVTQIVTALQQQLGTLDSWIDLLTAATGTALIELSATAAGFGIFAVERAFQEAFPDTAMLDSSIYAAARLLGARIARKLPASCTVSVTKPADGLAYTIPAYSQFTFPGGTMFNRQAIVFSTTQTIQNVTLYKGSINTLYLNGLGTDFQLFISSDAGFTVSDADVQVTVSNVVIPVVTDGLWHYQATVDAATNTTINKPAVQDRTTKDGQLELNFGDSVYGTSPDAGAPVVILYAVTDGASGNNASFTGTQLTYDAYSTVVATTGLSGGADELPASVYQRVAPPVSAAQGRASTYNEYNAIAVTYPGVLDARIQGQNLIAPTRPDFMAVLRCCLLTSTSWTSTQLADFLAWMKQRSQSPMNYWTVSPVPYQFNISANIYCNATADLNSVQQNVQNALQALTAAKYGILGGTQYLNDIHVAIRKADSQVLYAQLLSPTGDIVTSPQLYNLAASVTATGNIPAPGRTYQITLVSMNGGVTNESIPVDVTITNSTNFQATLTWTPASGAIDFINIYTTDSNGNTGLLTQLPGTASSYVDTGNTAPNIAQTPPTVDAFPVFYPQVGTITLNMFYASDRGIGQS